MCKSSSKKVAENHSTTGYWVKGLGEIRILGAGSLWSWKLDSLRLATGDSANTRFGTFAVSTM